MEVKDALAIGAAAFGALAAVLWFYASMVKVDDDPDDPSFKITDTIRGRRINVLDTAKAQTRWNARAAAAASIAAVCQVASLKF